MTAPWSFDGQSLAHPFTKPSEAASEPPRRRGHVSVSQLEQYARCGHAYYLKRVVGTPVKPLPSWAMVGGKAVHSALQDVVVERLKGKPEQAARAYSERLKEEIEAAQVAEPDTSLWRASGRKSKAWPDKENVDFWEVEGAAMVRKFATLYDTPFLPGRVVEADGRFLVEIEHYTDVGQPEDVKGYIDAVVEMPDGEILPRDYKSGAMRPASGLQLASYALAIEQMFGILPARGEYLLARKMERQSWDLTELRRPILSDLYGTLVRAKTFGIYLPNPSTSCSSCDVRAACVFKAPERSETTT